MQGNVQESQRKQCGSTHGDVRIAHNVITIIVYYVGYGVLATEKNRRCDKWREILGITEGNAAS